MTNKYVIVIEWQFNTILTFLGSDNKYSESSRMTVDDETIEALRQIHSQLKLDEEVGIE